MTAMLQSSLRHAFLFNSVRACSSSNAITHSSQKKSLMPQTEEIVTALPTYNLAPIVDHNDALKKLFHLGVKFSQWEKDGHLDLALSIIDFKKQVQPTIEFLTHRIGLNLQVVAHVLTNAPLLLQIDNQILESRVQYLESKKFLPSHIRKMITKRGDWLTYTVQEIDNRLGYFQKTFYLQGQEVRNLAVKDPALILWVGVPSQTRETLFAMKELMGFNKGEIQGLLLSNPELLRQPHEERMTKMFDFLHNTLGFSHALLAHLSKALLGDVNVAKERHAFLKFIGRAQYDNRKPNYVSPLALTIDNDKDFCRFTAKASEDAYNQFLKTL